jgi:competence protein ComEA
MLTSLEKRVIFFLAATFLLGIAVRVARFSPPSFTPLQESSPLININTADIEELTALPQVGIKTAGDIVAYRTAHGYFHNADELKKIKGIGEKKLEKLRPLIRF